MTTHTFPYEYIDSSKFSRPIIPVTLKHQDKHLTSYALLDSGADFCLFNGEISYILDIDLTRLEKTRLAGINGSAEGYIAHLEIGVNRSLHPVPVIFSFDFAPNGFSGLVGQIGFFDAFAITFDRANKRIVLQ